MDPKCESQDLSDPLRVQVPLCTECIGPSDFYLLEQDLPVTEASFLDLLQSLRNKSETLDKLRDGFLKHYRFYFKKKRFGEAETVLYEFARMRNTDNQMAEVVPAIHRFYRSRPGQKGREVADELRKMLSHAKDAQYWPLYRQSATICYLCGVPEAANSLSRAPVTEMTAADFDSWKSVYQWIFLKYCDNSRYYFNRAYSQWTIAEGIYQRNPGSQESLLAMVEFTRHYCPLVTTLWNQKTLNRSHLERVVSRISAASDPIIARAISVVFHPEFEWNQAGATTHTLRWAALLLNLPRREGSSHSYFSLLGTLLASFPEEYDTAKLIMLCTLRNDRDGTEILPNSYYHFMVKTFTDRRKFDTCEVAILRVGCDCKQVGGAQKLRIIYKK